MVYAGVDKVHRDLILGHSLAGMDIYYLKLSDDALRNAMEKFTLWMDEKMKSLNYQNVDLALRS